MTLPASGDGPITLRKPVEALVMVPRTQKLSPLGRKMYNVLLYASQMTLRTMDGIPPATHLFSAPLFEVLRICGAETQQSAAKRYLAEMRHTDVVWDSPDSNAELQQVGFALLAESRITQTRSGTIFVHWALPPTLYETLADPARWATIDLVMLSRLNNYAAIVLYEICSKYRNNPSRLTCKRDTAWWAELLSASPTQIDPKTGKRKLREWRKFKNAFVNDAIEEINTKTDLFIEMIETKGGGRAIEFVQFRVRIKEEVAQMAADQEAAVQASPELMQYARQLGIEDEKEVAESASRHGEAAVVRALRVLEQRQSQMSLELVRKPSRYFRTLMSNTQEERAGKGPENDGANNAPAQATPSAQVSASNRIVDDLAPETQAEAVGHDDFRQQKRDKALQELKAMPKDEIDRWLSAYGDALRAQGMLTPAIKKRLSSDDWAVGVVKSGMVQFYGQAKYGRSWDSEPDIEPELEDASGALFG